MITPPAQVLLQKAVTLQRAGRLEEAESLYHEILAQQDGHPEALHLLGLVAHQRGDHANAIRQISLAIKAGPACEIYYYNLGSVYLAAGQLDNARTAVESALRIRSDYPEALNLLGLLHSRLGMRSRAASCFARALEIRPDFVQALVNLGNSRNSENRADEAEACYRKALLWMPGSVFALVNLGNLLICQDRLGEAAECYKQALSSEPRSLDALNNLGSVLMRQGRGDDAHACFNRALAVDPSHAGVHFNKAWLHLLTGEFAKGWAEYSWRLKIEEKVGPVRRRLARKASKEWQGEPLAGKKILIYSEQGLGDTLQFCRYLPLLKVRGAEVIFICQPELLSLLCHAPGIDTLLPESADGVVAEPFDCHASLLNLPGLFKTDLSNIPPPFRWLNLEPAVPATWRGLLAVPEVKVGVVWAGKPSNTDDFRRSCSLNDFSPLSKISGTAFFSLQKGAAASQVANPPAGMNVTDLAPHLHDFKDTAIAIMSLDLVISVDTAVAHLAGALGKPVWTVLPHFPDWRWMLNSESTPWYATMRLLRQSSPGEWCSVFERAAARLNRMISRSGDCIQFKWDSCLE